MARAVSQFGMLTHAEAKNERIQWTWDSFKEQARHEMQLFNEHYHNHTNANGEDEDFWSEFEHWRETGFVQHGLYYYQLLHFRKFFPQHKLLILFMEEMHRSAQSLQKHWVKILDFLGLPFTPLSTTAASGLINGYPGPSDMDPIPEDLRTEMENFFKPRNRQLLEYLRRAGYSEDVEWLQP